MIQLNNALLEITNDCFLKCKHCYISKRNNNNLPFKSWMKIIDKLKIEFGTKRCVLLGGEPTLHPEFLKILQYAIDVFSVSEKGEPNVTVETSGVVPGTNFSDYNCNVSISFENVDPELNDAIRGTININGEEKSVFAVALWKIRALTRNPKIMRFTLMQDSDIVASLMLAEKCEANSVFIPLIPTGHGSELVDKVPDTTKIKRAMELIYNFNEVSQYSHMLDHPFYYLANPDLYHKFGKKFVERGRICQAGTGRIFISAQGIAAPCPFLTKYSIGDFLKKGKNNILKELKQFDETVKNVPLKHKCKTCMYQNICGACVATYINQKYKSGVQCPI